MIAKSAEIWGGLFWLALSAFTIWAGLDLGLGQVNDPGSGFVLFWLGCLMAALSSGVILGAFRDPGASVASLWRGTRWQKVLLVVVLLLAYGILFERVGFILNSILLLLILTQFVDRVALPVAIPLSFLAPIGIWYVITRWLKIQLPAGLLDGWIR